MAFIEHRNSFHGLWNLITEIETELYGNQLNIKDELSKSNNIYWTIYLENTNHYGLRWTPWKIQYAPLPFTIYSTEKVIKTACNRLNNLKERYATQQI